MSIRVNLEWNPIIVKELRSRMRGGRAFLTLTAALIFLIVWGFALYRLTIRVSQYNPTPLSPQVGQVLFTGLVFMELLLVCVITPAIAASAVSSEIEKQTHEMLLATPLPPASILWGKLIASLGYVFLLIFTAVPMASVIFVFGGVTLREMLKALVVLCVIALMLGVLGLFMSVVFQRTSRAIVATYLIVLLMTIGPFLVAMGISLVRQSDPPNLIMIPSPLSALGSSLSPSVNPQNLSSLFWMLGTPISWMMGYPQISQTSIPRPLYHYSVPLYLGLSLILYLIAARLIRPLRRWQVSWSEVVLALVLVLGFAGLVGLGYAVTAQRYEYALSSNVPTEMPLPAIPEKVFLEPIAPLPLTEEPSLPEPFSAAESPTPSYPTVSETPIPTP